MTSATGSRHRGFTLIELLTVLFIIGLLLSLTSIAFPNRTTAQAAHEESRRLAALLNLAAQDAVLKSRRIGVRIDKNAYRFLVQDPARRHWRPLEERVFAARRLPPPLRLALQTATTGSPQIIISASGEMTPFTLSLYSDTAQSHYTVRGSLTGRISLRRDLPAD